MVIFEITEKLLAIGCSLVIFSHAYLIRLTVGTFIFPASLLSLAWFLYTILPLTLLPDVPINPLAILYIAACLFFFSLGALPFNWHHAFSTNRQKTSEDLAGFNSTLLRCLFCLFSAGSIITSTASLASNDFDIQYLLLNLLEATGKFAALRGGGEIEYNAWGVLSIFFTYATPILGGSLSHQNRGRLSKLVIILLSFAPSVYFMITQSAKLVLFFSTGFFLAGLLLTKIYANELGLFNKSQIFKILSLALFTLPLVSVSFLSRGGNAAYEDFGGLYDVILFSIKSYFFGQLYAFSDFFSFYLGLPSESKYIHDFDSYGYYTFKSIFDTFGGQKYFPPGTFPDGYYHKEELATNIFTIFRGLIYDFGSVGVLGFMFIAGLVAHYFFFRLLTIRNAWLSCSVFIIGVVFIQGTYLFSIFMARYMYLLLVAFALIFWLNSVSNNITFTRKSTGALLKVLPRIPPNKL